MKSLLKLSKSSVNGAGNGFKRVDQWIVVFSLVIFGVCTTAMANDGASVIQLQAQSMMGGYISTPNGTQYSYIKVFPGEKRPETICPQKPVSTDELEIFNDNSCLHCLSNEGCAWARIESQCDTQEGIPLPTSLPCKISGSGGSLISENMPLVDCYNLDGTPLTGESPFIPVPHCQQ